MPEYILTATPYKTKNFSLKLSARPDEDSIDEKNHWLCDFSYRFKLNLYSVEKIALFVNGEPVDSKYENNELSCDRIFLDCYGFARLDFEIEFRNGQTLNLHTANLPVFINNPELNNSIKAMVDFINKNCAEWLFDGDLGSKMLTDYRAKNLEERLQLAEIIAATYEKNFSFFKTNCRCKIEKIPALDNFEKLQQITPAALQYLAAHPENLRQSSAGLKIGKRAFQPQKILTLKNNPSRNTYENRVVLWFLNKILEELANFQAKYELYDKKSASDGEYQNSLQFIFNWADSARQKISSLRDKFRRLLKNYSNALQIQPPPANSFSAPQPTSIFLSVPQYHQIFMKIYDWLKLKPYDFAKEKFLLACAKNWSLYEKYLLLKFIDYLCNFQNFIPINKFHINYPLEENSLHRQPDCLNTFIFSDKKNTITIYYQPVIYNTLQKATGGPNLYRNNSVVWDAAAKGYYYVPDFIIKFENSSEPVQYIIVDAKFSRIKNLFANQLQKFILKYIFSISPINNDEKICAYRLVFAKCEIDSAVTNVFDYQFPGKNISPSFKMVPLIENLKAQNLSLHEIFNPM